MLEILEVVAEFIALMLFFVAGIVAFKGLYYIDHPLGGDYRNRWVRIVTICILYDVLFIAVGIGSTIINN